MSDETRMYTGPSHLLKEIQEVAFNPAMPGDVTTKTTQVMSYIAIAMIAVQLERIETHLGNIHQTLITPDANREPVTAADMLASIARSLEIIVQRQMDSRP